MGAKISFSETEILDAAIQVLRKNGENSLTARNIAEVMNGSTQPIYRVFRTMDKLTSELCNRIEEIAIEYMSKEMAEDHEFLSIGIGYFRFAVAEPELFRYIYMSGRKNLYLTDSKKSADVLLDKMRREKFLKLLDDHVLESLLRDMSIYSHGLCTLAVIKPGSVSEETYTSLLNETGTRMVTYEIMKKYGYLDEEFKRRFENENCGS